MKASSLPIDGIIRYVNAAFETLSGFPRDRILGANPHEIKVSTDLSDPATELWDALNHEQSWTGYIRHRKTSGQVCEIEATVSPILHESGFVNSYILTATAAGTERDGIRTGAVA